MDFSHHTDDLPRLEDDAGAAPRMELRQGAGSLGRERRKGHACQPNTGYQLLDQTTRRVEVCRHSFTVRLPPRRLERAHQQAAYGDVLCRDRHIGAILFCACCLIRCLLRLHLPDAPDLEQRKRCLLIGGVVLRHVQQRGNQRTAQPADLG